MTDYMCDSCGSRVKRLETDPETGKKVCLKCYSANWIYPLTEAEISFENEKRTHLRIPVVLGMRLNIGGRKTSGLTYDASCVNLSLSGMCVGWKMCKNCTGYIENGLHEACILCKYSRRSSTPNPLLLKIQVTEHSEIEIDGYVVYTQKEESIGYEYIGIEFGDLTGRDIRILEQIILKTNKQKKQENTYA